MESLSCVGGPRMCTSSSERSVRMDLLISLFLFVFCFKVFGRGGGGGGGGGAWGFFLFCLYDIQYTVVYS